MTGASKPILLDCDPGIDDAIAVLLGLNSPEIDIRAITTVAGNVGLSSTTRNARALRDLAGRPDIKVHAGCPKAILGAPPIADHVHGGDGLGGVILDEGAPAETTHALDAMIELAANVEGLSLVAVGPLTNLGVLVTMRPEVADTIARTVIMGGGIARGNVTPHAEFNIHVDPEAARAVFESRLEPVLVPLDLTRKAAVGEAWINRLRAVGKAPASAAADMLTFYLNAVKHREEGVIIHDATALAVEIWPDLFRVEPARIDVVTDHTEERGRTLVDFKSTEPNGSVAVDVDADTLSERLFQRLAELG
jgi:inosine-uridine nucleoside N-ribohydrolase